jgi:hypothetical protein
MVTPSLRFDKLQLYLCAVNEDSVITAASLLHRRWYMILSEMHYVWTAVIFMIFVAIDHS